MDADRQYASRTWGRVSVPSCPGDAVAMEWNTGTPTEVVQYIIQSEAGFYMKGVRLTAGSVQKMSRRAASLATRHCTLDANEVARSCNATCAHEVTHCKRVLHVGARKHAC